ncbi:MAG: hypothetical protein V4668_03190 [Patescibacteria group bacterium]
MLEFTLYHKILRISSVVLAVALVFQSGLLSNTTALMTLSTQSYLANVVGVSVGVTPTELNTITAGLTAKELALDARDRELTEREIAIGLSGQSGMQDKTTFMMGLTLFIVVLLLVLNYALDYLRARQQGSYTILDMENDGNKNVQA